MGARGGGGESADNCPPHHHLPTVPQVDKEQALASVAGVAAAPPSTRAWNPVPGTGGMDTVPPPQHLKGLAAGQGPADPMQAWFAANKTRMGIAGALSNPLGLAVEPSAGGEGAPTATATASQGTWWQDPFLAFGTPGVLAQAALSAGAFNVAPPEQHPPLSTPTLLSGFSGSAATLLHWPGGLEGADHPPSCGGTQAVKVGKPSAVKATPKSAASILMKLSRTNTRKTKSKHKRRDRSRD